VRISGGEPRRRQDVARAAELARCDFVTALRVPSVTAAVVRCPPLRRGGGRRSEHVAVVPSGPAGRQPAATCVSPEMPYQFCRLIRPGPWLDQRRSRTPAPGRVGPTRRRRVRRTQLAATADAAPSRCRRDLRHRQALAAVVLVAFQLAAGRDRRSLGGRRGARRRAATNPGRAILKSERTRSVPRGRPDRPRPTANVQPGEREDGEPDACNSGCPPLQPPRSSLELTVRQ
jgi:hypothetical protein